MTEYPRDQFDDVPEYRDRQGSHRSVAEPSGGTGPSGLTWISLAAALALAIGAFSFFILPTLQSGGAPGPEAAGPGTAGASVSVSAAPGQGASPAAGGPDGSPDVAESPSGSAPAGSAASPPPTAATGGTGASDEAGDPAPTATSAPTATPGPTETPQPTPSPEVTEEPATVDYSVPVEVYNASRVGGLAGRVGGTLSGAGYTVATAGNWSGFPVTSSAVFYSSNEATAQAVAGRLGLPAVYDGRVPGIAVVLTAAYAS